ncbi:MAG: FmdB family transcriptional regulator [Actinomycetota bacterium]|nr:FmdB family transcriptional regulator [Actinomycetota bacterium]
MPIYEYACTACGERTEAKQGFDDPPLEDCPLCGGRLRKMYSPVGIVFKGSGFYSTDGRKSGKAEKAKTEGSKAGSSKDEPPKKESSPKSTKPEKSAS